MTSDQPPNSIERPSGVGDLPWQVLNSLTAGIAVVDRTGTIRAVNAAWTDFSRQNDGSPEKTGVGSNYFAVCRSASGEDSIFADRACRGIEEVLAGVQDEYKLEYPCHSKTKKRWFLLYVTRLKNDPSCVVTTHLSITERKVVEKQLVDAERLAAIGQAMQGLSHEGRNTLQRAQGCIDLLRCHVERDHEALRLLQRIEASQRQMLGLYEEVKSYASPITLNRGSFRLDEIVDEVWSLFQSHPIQAKLSHVLSRTDLTCLIDVAAISEVLKLVFDNALTTGAQFPEIQVSYADTELDGKPAITIIVDDNGPGIGTGDSERLFEPFCTTKQRGTGLGLAICRRIISAHGGRIGFDTHRHRGASVRITLPASA